MEVLSDILRSMRVAGSVYFCDRLEAPWSLEFADPDRASFHLIRRGECWITSGDVSERLGPGDFVFLEPGRDHVLANEGLGKAANDRPVTTLLLCGYCQFEAPKGHPLLKALPSLTIIREEELLQHRWLKSTLDQLSTEFMSRQPGSELVLDKLTEILIVELVRINFGRSAQSGFTGALLDKQISKGLELLHAAPERSWTLDTLASELAMSRAAFAKRFKERVGQTMFEYLTALRMQRAQLLLRESDLPLYAVADRVGYQSDLAFTKAFKRLLGVTPTIYRKTWSVDKST
jgi:AraC-like DNA-binding protein